ncbi:hypothetical protein HPG69_004163 [Diceros bicornis minor]|uniref:Uncharacterized protein n=1 Tax=Diceros bicornis minor TaxID=77932 RepID=A0A7J7E9K0_DICBM|nr:hypothetical protein HPG69_004163 [Diceros bicornis minor]
MSFRTKVSFLVVATSKLILRMLGNRFIGLLNCIEWVKNGKVSSADFILTSLAMARIIQLQFLLLLFHLAEVESERSGSCAFPESFFFLSVNLLMQDALSELWMNTHRVHERHMTWHLDVDKIFHLKSLLLPSLTCVIPFPLSLTSLFLLYLSLLRHQEFAAQPDECEGLQHRGP